MAHMQDLAIVINTVKMTTVTRIIKDGHTIGQCRGKSFQYAMS